MQINPGGNRRLNWTVHVIAIVRLRVDGGRSKEFVEKAYKQWQVNVPLYGRRRHTLLERSSK
jgi:hypothetical protein